MLQDFDIRNTLKNVEEYNKDSQEYEKIVKAINEIRSLSYVKNAEKSRIESEKSKALIEKNKINIFSKIASFFHRGEYYKINKQIEDYERKLKELEEECLDIDKKINELENGEKLLLEQKESKKTPECIRKEEDNLIITDKEEYDLDSKKSLFDEKVIVHCTNFFPKDNIILSNYDGGKICSTIVNYHGVKKEVSALSHRHEVHFTTNARVENTGAGEGNWDNPQYMIIDRYNEHQDEMECTIPSDGWTKGSSMKLSDKAVIMVRLQDKDKLPISEEEMENYNLIYYDGKPTKCLNNFLKLNNYKISHTDPNCPAHAHSTRILQERGLDNRDLAINFYKDNTYLSKELPIFSKEDIAQITDIAIKSRNFNILKSEQKKLCLKDRNISEGKEKNFLKVVNFVITSGMTKTNDGKYTFKTDEEVLEDIENLDNSEEIPQNINLDLIEEIFEMQQQVAIQHDNAQLPDIESLSSMTLQELYLFKNQLACEIVQKNLQEDYYMYCEKEYISFEIYDDACDEIKEKMNKNDGMNLGYSEVRKNIDKDRLVGDIGRIFEEFSEEIESIKSRKEENIEER